MADILSISLGLLQECHVPQLTEVNRFSMKKFAWHFDKEIRNRFLVNAEMFGFNNQLDNKPLIGATENLISS